MDLLQPAAWYIRSFVVSASVSAQRDSGPGVSEQLSDSDRCTLLPVAIKHTARVAGKIVSELQAQNVAHNVTFSCVGGAHWDLSGPNRAMPPQCATRFESDSVKLLAMQKRFLFASDAQIPYLA